MSKTKMRINSEYLMIMLFTTVAASIPISFGVMGLLGDDGKHFPYAPAGYWTPISIFTIGLGIAIEVMMIRTLYKDSKKRQS